MNISSRYFTALFFLSLLLVSTQFNANAYDPLHGLEENDIVEVAFVRHIDGKFSIEYSENNPFTIKVNENEINVNFINGILGMKIGETKPVIRWYIHQTNGTDNYIEYFNTTIVRLIHDATPDVGPVGRGFLITFEVIAGVAGAIGLIYVATRLRRRLALKNCINCTNNATSKCSKCGTFHCAECISKGCLNCGSRQFIRLNP